MRNVSTSMTSFLLLTFLMFNLTYVESLSACEPLTDSCCCKEETLMRTNCNNTDLDVTNNCCSPSEKQHKSHKKVSCRCSADLNLPAYASLASSVTVTVKTAPLYTPFSIPEIESNIFCEGSSLAAYIGIIPLDRVTQFTNTQWPTICLIC